jgi:hypothetical protein
MKGTKMETQTTGRSKRQKPYGFYKKLFILTITGGAVFWIVSIVTSLLPIAAKYRAAFSNWSIQTVWIASLPMGLMIGCCVSYSFLRLFTRFPAKRPVLKAVIMSSAALVIAIILIHVPMILHASSGALFYFLVGVIFDAARFLILGITVGYLYERLYG